MRLGLIAIQFSLTKSLIGIGSDYSPALYSQLCSSLEYLVVLILNCPQELEKPQYAAPKLRSLIYPQVRNHFGLILY